MLDNLPFELFFKICEYLSYEEVLKLYMINGSYVDKVIDIYDNWNKLSLEELIINENAIQYIIRTNHVRINELFLYSVEVGNIDVINRIYSYISKYDILYKFLKIGFPKNDKNINRIIEEILSSSLLQNDLYSNKSHVYDILLLCAQYSGELFLDIYNREMGYINSIQLKERDYFVLLEKSVIGRNISVTNILLNSYRFLWVEYPKILGQHGHPNYLLKIYYNKPLKEVWKDEPVKNTDNNDTIITDVFFYRNIFFESIRYNNKDMLKSLLNIPFTHAFNIKNMIDKPDNYILLEEDVNINFTRTETLFNDTIPLIISTVNLDILRENDLGELLMISCSQGHLAIVKALISRGTSVKYNNNAPFCTACLFNKEEIIKYLITIEDVDPSSRNLFGLSCLMCYKKYDLVNFILGSFPTLKTHKIVEHFYNKDGTMNSNMFRPIDDLQRTWLFAALKEK